jgi:hypothetical protein
LSRAIDRVINTLEPARKGGQGAKDAAILEHAVSLVDALLVGGFAGRRVFVCSNRGDFATAKTTAVHPDIRSVFDPPRDIHYSVSLSAAVTWLKASGWGRDATVYLELLPQQEGHSLSQGELLVGAAGSSSFRNGSGPRSQTGPSYCVGASRSLKWVA